MTLHGRRSEKRSQKNSAAGLEFAVIVIVAALYVTISGLRMPSRLLLTGRALKFPCVALRIQQEQLRITGEISDLLKRYTQSCHASTKRSDIANFPSGMTSSRADLGVRAGTQRVFIHN